MNNITLDVFMSVGDEKDKHLARSRSAPLSSFSLARVSSSRCQCCRRQAPPQTTRRHTMRASRRNGIEE